MLSRWRTMPPLFILSGHDRISNPEFPTSGNTRTCSAAAQDAATDACILKCCSTPLVFVVCQLRPVSELVRFDYSDWH